MKIGIRTPNVKRSVSARTKGKITRAVKSSYDPTYRKKGVGWLKDPKKAAYNKVYNKTTTSAVDLMKQKGIVSKNFKINEDKDYSWIEDCYPKISMKISEKEYVEKAVLLSTTPFVDNKTIQPEEMEKIKTAITTEKIKEFKKLKKQRKRTFFIAKIAVFICIFGIILSISFKDYWLFVFFVILFIIELTATIKLSK